jgi:predicted phage terminase large subunit-like protein
MTLTAYEWAARQFEPRTRRYPSPLALGRHLDPRSSTTAALNLIDQALVDLTDGNSDENALMVSIPPQEAKSTTCCRRFPEWLLEHTPELRVAIVSYELDVALRWGRDIKRDIDLAGPDLPITIRADSSAAGRWETPQGGGVYCVGIGGPLSGRPVDVLVIDDPCKDRADAESERMRDRAWDWWESVALARFGPITKTVLIMTRWQEDDLAGRILSRPSPLKWRVLKIPAIAEADDVLGRRPGEELVSVRGRKPGYFLNLRATMGAYTFSSIYQQSPTAAEGNFFRRSTFRFWRLLEPWSDGRERLDLEGRVVTLSDCWRFGTVDVAASTKTSADYTVISMWAVAPEGDLILLGRARAQVAQHDHFSLAGPLFERWGECPLYVERHFFASTLVADAQAAGIPVAEVTADTDKITRAVPAAGRVHAGRAWFPAETSGCTCGNCEPAGVWLDEWCDELASFPTGTHDDQVDTFSYAARILTAEWTPPTTPPRHGVDPHERAINLAAGSATGSSGFDPMTVPY